MIIFNTTFHIDDSIHDDCLDYIKNVYIPKSLEDELLEQPSLSKIESQHKERGVNYALQFKSNSVDELNEWKERVGEGLQVELSNKYGDKVMGFVTLLEEIPLK